MVTRLAQRNAGNIVFQPLNIVAHRPPLVLDITGCALERLGRERHSALPDIAGKPLDMLLKAIGQSLFFRHSLSIRNVSVTRLGAAFVSGTVAIEVRERLTAGLTKMKPSDVRNNLSNFGVFKRRPAAHAVPGEEQFQRHAPGRLGADSRRPVDEVMRRIDR